MKIKWVKIDEKNIKIELLSIESEKYYKREKFCEVKINGKRKEKLNKI
jgi:hypothetical protein